MPRGRPPTVIFVFLSYRNPLIALRPFSLFRSFSTLKSLVPEQEVTALQSRCPVSVFIQSTVTRKMVARYHQGIISKRNLPL